MTLWGITLRAAAFVLVLGLVCWAVWPAKKEER